MHPGAVSSGDEVEHDDVILVLHVALLTNGKSERIVTFEAQVPDCHDCFLPERILMRLPLKQLYVAVHSSRGRAPNLPDPHTPQTSRSILFLHDYLSRLQVPNSHYGPTHALSLTKPLAHP